MTNTKKRQVYCPGCTQTIEIPDGVEVGDLFECVNCAGVKLRLMEGEEGLSLKIVQMVACPGCGGKIPVDDDTPGGTTLSHDGEDFHLAKEFGAFTLEPATPKPATGERASS